MREQDRNAKDGSCAVVLARLREGDEAAAVDVFLRFRDRLVALARARLQRRLRAKVDPEDILQSVLRSFFTRHREGQLRARSWESLWNLLALMTARKCANQAARFQSARRDVKREIPLDRGPKGCEGAAGDPTPSHAAVVAEILEQLVAKLDERDREVLFLHLEGCTAQETAARIGRAERTVRRTLERVRRVLESLESEGSSGSVEGPER